MANEQKDITPETLPPAAPSNKRSLPTPPSANIGNVLTEDKPNIERNESIKRMSRMFTAPPQNTAPTKSPIHSAPKKLNPKLIESIAGVLDKKSDDNQPGKLAAPTDFGGSSILAVNENFKNEPEMKRGGGPPPPAPGMRGGAIPKKPLQKPPAAQNNPAPPIVAPTVNTGPNTPAPTAMKRGGPPPPGPMTKKPPYRESTATNNTSGTEIPKPKKPQQGLAVSAEQLGGVRLRSVPKPEEKLYIENPFNSSSIFQSKLRSSTVGTQPAGSPEPEAPIVELTARQKIEALARSNSTITPSKSQGEKVVRGVPVNRLLSKPVVTATLAVNAIETQTTSDPITPDQDSASNTPPEKNSSPRQEIFPTIEETISVIAPAAPVGRPLPKPVVTAPVAVNPIETQTTQETVPVIAAPAENLWVVSRRDGKLSICKDNVTAESFSTAECTEIARFMKKTYGLTNQPAISLGPDLIIIEFNLENLYFIENWKVKYSATLCESDQGTTLVSIQNQGESPDQVKRFVTAQDGNFDHLFIKQESQAALVGKLGVLQEIAQNQTKPPEKPEEEKSEEEKTDCRLM